MFKIKTIHSYILSKFLSKLVVSTIFFISFLVVFYSFRLVPIVISKDVRLIESIKMILYLSAGFIPMALPMSVYFSINSSISNMCSNSEFVAMKSFGISKFMALKPVLVFSIILSILMFYLNDKLVPISQKNFKNTMLRLSASGVLTDINPRRFFNEIPGNILYAKKVNKVSKQMYGLFLWTEKNNTLQLISAKEGRLIKKYASKNQIPSLRLHLENGNILKISTNNRNGYQKIFFKEYNFPLLQGGGKMPTSSKLIFMSNNQLLNKLKANKLELLQTRDSHKIKNIQKEIRLTWTTYLNRYATSMQIIFFTIIGFSLGIKDSRSTKSSSLLSYGIVFMYYVMYFSNLSFIKKGILSPEISLLIIISTFTFLTFYLYKKTDWTN